MFEEPFDAVFLLAWSEVDGGREGISITSSLTPVTVTIWARFQFALVKVRLDGLGVPSLLLLLAMAMLTSAVGAVASTTLKLAVPPASVVVSPVVGVTIRPGTGIGLINVPLIRY